MTTRSNEPDAAAAAPPRAKPLSVEDRQAMIIDAVIPLILERGHAVTTRQIAEAAGVAEGTIFRAFKDKETLIAAAVDRHLDPEPLRRQLALIDPALPLEHKVRAVIALLQARFAGIFSLMAALGHHGRPHHRGPISRAEYGAIIAAVLAPDLDRLIWPADRIGPLIRLIAFSSSLPMFNEVSSFSLDELTRFVLHGIAGGDDLGDPGTAATASSRTNASSRID